MKVPSFVVTSVVAPAGIFLGLMGILKTVLSFTSKEYKDVEIEKNTLSENGKSKSIRFLQYNAFWRPTMLHFGREEYMRERSMLVLDKIQDFDVVCLEEAFQFGSTIVRNFAEAAKQRGFKYICSSKNPPLLTRQVVDPGLLVLSKYPILETANIRYRDGCGFDSFSAKGAVYVKIQIDETKHIHLFSTHLQASYQRGPTSEDVGIRCRQLDHLSRFMKEKVTDGYPVVVLGDFNVDSRKGTEYELLMQHLNLDEYNVTNTLYASNNNEHVVTFGESQGDWIADKVLTVQPDWGTNQSLDYIFLLTKKDSPLEVTFDTKVNKMTVEGRPYPQLSDHYGVESTMTFTSK